MQYNNLFNWLIGVSIFSINSIFQIISTLNFLIARMVNIIILDFIILLIFILKANIRKIFIDIRFSFLLLFILIESVFTKKKYL